MICASIILIIIFDLKNVAVAVPASNLGCYEDQPKYRLLRKFLNRYEFQLTPLFCVENCEKKGYQYAGVQDGTDCYCGTTQPPQIAKVPQTDCNSNCSGDLSKYCGGTDKIDVYHTAITDKIGKPSPYYLGCFSDDRPIRFLHGYVNEMEKPSPTYCHNTCYARGYLFYGLAFGNQCLCGDQQPDHDLDILEDEDRCSMACTGNSNFKCGGIRQISVFATGITDFPIDNLYFGCFMDLDMKKFESSLTTLSSTNSPRRCMNLCTSKGFKFSGLHSGIQCHCFNNSLVGKYPTEEFTSCGDSCVGDVSEFCGAASLMKVYRTLNNDDKREVPTEYIGCYEDQERNRALEKFQGTYEYNLTPDYCVSLCEEKGYPYAGVQYAIECFCGFRPPPALAKVDESKCKLPCSGDKLRTCGGHYTSNVYRTTAPYETKQPALFYLGCFVNNNKFKPSPQYSQQLENLTPTQCSDICYKKGFLYFGLIKGKTCACTDQLLDNKQEDSLCSSHCPGDVNRKCGSSTKVSMYSTGITDYATKDPIGCYQNELKSRIPSIYIEYPDTNSPRRCLNICMLMGYKYAGVEYVIECHCFNEIPANQTKLNNAICGNPCPNSKDQVCGAGYVMKIYKTVKEPSKRKEPITQSTTETAKIEIRNNGPCVLSQTTMNGQSVCKNQVIFKEKFDTLDTSIWAHTIKMANEPDYEFVTFTSSESNCYAQNGSLWIKPTIQDDMFVTAGSITLANCTGVLASLECTKTAIGPNFLPPISTARISTELSFTFRYGIMSVLARLPKGNWILPEIWLQPKGSNAYEREEIKIAFSRGNDHYYCNGLDIGRNQLEVGYCYNGSNTLKCPAFKHVRAWGDNLHNFTLLWTPGKMEIIIDESLLAPIGVEPQRDGLINEYYITLGLSVGGFREFSDECNTGGEPKPWGNRKANASLTFWMDLENWSRTWIGDSTSLQIEEITVTSI